MILEVNDRSYVVFDLDDTLYPEIDFVYSGIHHLSTVLEPIIGQSVADALLTRHGDKQEMFGWLVEKFHLPLEFGVERLLDEYRHHPPILSLPEGSRRLLDQLSALGIPMGLLTDGRSVSQRNKVKALGVANRLSDILISEEFGSAKPDPRNYQEFERRHPGRQFAIVADNPLKDFQVPTELGWLTICLRASENNIHSQDLEREPRPLHVVDSLGDIIVRRVTG